MLQGRKAEEGSATTCLIQKEKKKEKKKKSITVSKVSTVSNVSFLSAHKDLKETTKKSVFFLLSPSAVQPSRQEGSVLR